MSAGVIGGAYLADLLAQPRAIADTLSGLHASPSLGAVATRVRSFERIVLTGMGASLSALLPLHLRLVARGLPALRVETSELVHAMPALLGEGSLVVAVSQSGRSGEIVRLAEWPARRFTLVGVTNTPGSPLAMNADAVVPLSAGPEASVSCKTYVATLAALGFLGDLLVDGRAGAATAALHGVPALVQAYLDRWEDHVAALTPLVDGVSDLFFAGRGVSLAAAETAGLILKEATRAHAEGLSSAALRHGPIEMMSDRVLALVYEGAPAVAALNRALVDDLRRAGARAWLAGPAVLPEALRVAATGDEESREAQRPVLEILPAQLISIALAALRGLEAGRFVHTSKVTATE